MRRRKKATPTGAYGQSGLALPLFEDLDPCAAHHHGAETSVAAHELVRPFKRQSYARILAALEARGAAGGTVHELAADLGKLPSDISGRLFELRANLVLTFVFDVTGAVLKRGGARVVRIAGDHP